MNKWLKRSILSSALLVATQAHAAEWSDYGTISHLEVSNGAYKVWFSGVNNPATCGNTNYLETLPSESDASIAEMNKMLLAAFLSGKEVRFSVSSATCGPTDRPAYGNVRVRF